ncbi:MarR family winged helix-turn-helix transcriptional regulator [Microbacterium sp. Yaish 1]|uniref:MarR family winged helix-turn-helix transcriptional regulator n=1 Tax=Microbacterium sp. Yaish 1 TaxID=2025014 RepID=UPI000B93EBF8|nr:MarR family transcriptional regulator [Microbacterium sp. Yaish 1]OYC97903.1 hypothetical protein CI089_05095 [Microbacterium sp. Yaish 1]
MMVEAGHEELAERVSRSLQALTIAEDSARARVCETLKVGVRDFAALRLLLRAHRDGAAMSPKDISQGLAISSASTTALLDRLEKGGHLHRVPHPADRRRVFIELSDKTVRSLSATVDEESSRVSRAIADLPATTAEGIIEFLDRLHAPSIG